MYPPRIFSRRNLKGLGPSLSLSVCHLLSIPALQAAIERHLQQGRKAHCVQTPLRALFCFTEARLTSAPFTLKEVVITPLLLALWLQLHTKKACEVGSVVNNEARVGGGRCMRFRRLAVFVKKHQFKLKLLQAPSPPHPPNP